MSRTSLDRVPLLDPATAEAGIQGLERLAKMMAAANQGKMPSSDQLQSIVQRVLKSNLLQPELGSRVAGKVGGGRLSDKGRQLVVETRSLLEALVQFGLTHNGDDKIQRFLWTTSQASVDVDADVDKPDLPLPSNKEIAQVEDSLKQLGSTLLTSSELRNILTDLVHLGRDLFADAAEQVAEAAVATTKSSKKLANKARVSEQEREQGKTGLEGVENLTTKDIKKHTVRGIEDAKDDAQKALNRKAKETKEWVDEALDTDIKDAFIERFKKIVKEIESKPEYKDSVNTIVTLVRKYAAKSKEAVKQAAQSASAKVETNKEADSALSLLRQIIEEFTGDLTPVFKSLDKIVDDVKEDSRVDSIFSELDELLDRAVNDPGYITTSRAQRRVEALWDQGQEVIKSNPAWQQDADILSSEAQKCLKRAANDKSLQQLSDKFERWARSFAAFGRTGFNLVDGGGVWADVTQVFVPRLLSALEAVPLPRVEFTSAEVDLIIDNVRFTSDSFIPDAIHFKNRNEISCRKGYAAYATEFSTATTFSFSGLRLAAKDISYYLAKKGGWIGLEDYGLLDVWIGTPGGDDGLDVTLTVENADEHDRESYFKVKKVDVDISGFKIRLHNSGHPVRNWFVQPAVRGYLEKQFKVILEEQIGNMFKTMDRKMYDMSLKAEGAFLAASDPLAFFKGVFGSTSSSGLTAVSSTGITKVGPQGAWLMAIGVDEQLLPGKRTGLSQYGRDVVSQKRSLEALVEEGRAELREAREIAEDIADDVRDEASRIEQEAREQNRQEAQRNGWRSPAFDL
ncbi:hypothetical protein OIO90_002618 [Microbotryomycetes sp. JL221]|nr:hypothetical protein OIO90_002618 [Microbotryomycetes sp. JL221]